MRGINVRLRVRVQLESEYPQRRQLAVSSTSQPNTILNSSGGVAMKQRKSNLGLSINAFLCAPEKSQSTSSISMQIITISPN